MCKKVGIQDVCQTYKQTRLDNIISGCSSKELQCKLCKKVFSSHQKLRESHKTENTLRRLHTIVSECKRYFADSGSLKLHMVSHDPTASKFACMACPQAVFHQKPVAENTRMCTRGKKYQCQFCPNKYTPSTRGSKSMKLHVRGNPQYKEGDTSGWFKCRLCQKLIKHHRSLLRAPQKQA